MSVGTAQLRDIRGPSAVGGGWRRLVNLTWLIASTDFKLTYFGSALGYLWSLMRPLMFFGVLYVVFAQIVHFGKDIVDYPVILLLNIVLFSFFQEATGSSIASLVVRESLVRKMQFPRLVIPLASVLSAAMNLAVNLFAVLVFLVIYGVTPRATWLFLPLLFGLLAMISAGFAMGLSALYVRFRDVAPIWSVVSQALFYASPIFYVAGASGAVSLHGEVLRIYLCSPFAAILTQARRWIIDPHAPGTPSLMGGDVYVVIPAAIIVLVFLGGLLIFRHEVPRIAEEL